MRDWKPIFIENSWVPKVLSCFSPISIDAITLGFIVFGRAQMDDKVRQHETIHFQQFLETLFVGFLILYFYDYICGRFKYRDSTMAYYNIRAEREAYENEKTTDYLTHRIRWKWMRNWKNETII